MSYNKWYRITVVLLTSFFLITCQKGKNEKVATIIGKWELEEALRNGRPAASLEDIFFEFFADGSMRTNFNLTGNSETGTFEIFKGELRQRETQLHLNYNIIELNDSVLILSTKLRDADFQLLLSRRRLEQ